MVKVTVVVPFNAMLDEANVFKMTGGLIGGGFTVSCAVAVGPWVGDGPVQFNVEVVLVCKPAVIPVTVTVGSAHVPLTGGIPEAAGMVAPVRVIAVEVTVKVPPVQGSINEA
jgi:hypothetical protein